METRGVNIPLHMAPARTAVSKVGEMARQLNSLDDLDARGEASLHPESEDLGIVYQSKEQAVNLWVARLLRK